jgi:hypothetical protein
MELLKILNSYPDMIQTCKLKPQISRDYIYAHRRTSLPCGNLFNHDSIKEKGPFQEGLDL